MAEAEDAFPGMAQHSLVLADVTDVTKTISFALPFAIRKKIET